MEYMIGIRKTEIDGIKLITPYYTEDERGYFLKSFERDSYAEAGLKPDIYESFETYSKKNVIRGLHFQTKNPQVKLIRAITGAIYDVVVDLRKASKTFGKYAGYELSSRNRETLWIPAGFAHGYKVLSEDAIVSYHCIGKYFKEYDTGIKWDDPDLAINWDITDPVVSSRDNGLPSFQCFIQNQGGI
jgi:dTDP-4-dehydrorhamnose 3,5-epimerase